MRRLHVPRGVTRRVGLALSLLTLVVGGCDGCHSRKPFTPFKLGDEPDGSTAPPASSAQSLAAPDGGPAFTVIPGKPPSGDGKSWALEGGVTVAAPPGRTFAQGLVLDLDGDKKPDLLAWARTPDGLRGELWFASGANPEGGRTVAALPSDLTAGGCSATGSLALVGPRTVTFDFVPKCGGANRDKAVRWLAFLRLPEAAGGVPEIGLELRLGATAEGEALQIAVDPRDRDGDGRADVTLGITLTGAPKPLTGGSASASLAFLERPAGLSRDPSEPEASFKQLAQALIADGRRKTTSARVGPAALTARRLHSLLCEEGGKPVITMSAAPIRCGAPHFADETLMAEIEAAFNLQDPVSAFAALGRFDSLAAKPRKDLDTLIAKSVPSIAGNRVHTTTALPAADASGVSPLAFTTAGDLLVKTKDGVVKVTHGSFDEAPADPAPAWLSALSSGGDAPEWKLTAVEERCDAPALIAHFEGGDQKSEVALPIPTSPKCSPGAKIPLAALGSSTSGVLVSVRGEAISIPAKSPPRPTLADALGAAATGGAARSPDGGTLAIPTSRGVLVAKLKGSARGATAKLWTGPMADGVTACVPENGGARLACAAPNGAAIYEAR